MDRTKITIGEERFKTYPFGDPDPIPATGERRYPYFRYDGSTDAAEDRVWKTVTLDNDRIAVKILPEVGGKVWGAYDKVAQRDFLYSNHVMKFRDVATRGPWTSGGIEFNFGVIGHSPSTSTPVDWCVRENADGSASCFVGGDEYVSRTRWQVEIRLAPEADEFETRAIWYNASGLPAPYYHWMNAAYSLRDDPQFLFPGDAMVGHEGEIVTRTWPLDSKGRDISVYANNAYGGHKSFHTVGGNAGFYGIWWRGLGYGSYHRSLPYAKYGRKIWCWALSREGGIWEDLLTDDDGQYAELQAGRGFNQPRFNNVYTPFKHPTFAPGTTEVFTDHWGPIRSWADAEREMNAPSPKPRPIESPKLDWESAAGLALLGLQALRTRDEADAEAKLNTALAKEPNSALALRGLAELAYRHGQYARVHEFAWELLAQDLYDEEANYLDGAAYFAEGDLVSARDRLGVAAFSGASRAAAFALIARSYLREDAERLRVPVDAASSPRRNKDNASQDAAEESLRCEGLQQDALIVKAILLRGRPEQRKFLETILTRLPLAHAFRYELEGIEGLKKIVTNELPYETYLELGSWYEETGLVEDAKTLFRAALPNPEAEIRLAFLEGRAPVLDGPVGGVFPFRRESRPALEAAAKTCGWKGAYLLAVLKAFFGERAEALALLDACGDEPDEAVFYVYRARLRASVDAASSPRQQKTNPVFDDATRTSRLRKDLLRAQSLGDDWRIGRDLVELYENAGDFAQMLAAAAAYLAKYPTKNPIQIGYARALQKLNRHADCMNFLRTVKILPSEHKDSATDIWQTCQAALGEPLTWPENLGKGEPYHDGEFRQRG